jgi:E3 ubiquitin-protein ligase EL5
MAVTGTSVAAATTMLAAAAAIFVTFVLCFYLFLCAKRYRGAAPAIGGGGRGRLVFSAGGCHGSGSGMAEQAIAALPRKEVAAGEPPADCAVCIAELVAGERSRVLPRCGHGFHVECVDVWLRSHSTCPLCRCAVVDDEVEVKVEADSESPVFPTNVLFFGSQGTVSTRALSPLSREPPQQQAAPGGPIAAVVEAARVAALRRLLGCRGATASSTPQQQQVEGRDLESGLGESSGSPPAKPQPGSY